MLLADIDLDSLQAVPFDLAWGKNEPALNRMFYRRDGLFYKIWGSSFHVADLVLVNGRYIEHKFASPDSGIAAIDVGLVCDETCPGLVDLLWDGSRRCRGYIMREGVQLQSLDEVDESFFQSVCQRSLMTGYASTDFCPKNIVRIDGRLSLIDLDTVPTKIDALDIEMEKQGGCLRSHIVPAYREFILRLLENRNSPRISSG